MLLWILNRTKLRMLMLPKEVKRWLVLFMVIVLLVQESQTLTDAKVIIPPAVVRGEKVTLRCHYDLESDQLYAVKWYKGGREFYRFVQTEKPPIKQFPIKGVRVIETQSNDTQLVLDDVIMKTSGNYSCEVSADAPSFFTRMDSGILQVIDTPRHDPQISGLKNRYRIGDVLKAHCTCKESNPAANLTWLVNGEPVSSVHIRHQWKNSEKPNLKNAHSGLTLHITKDLFSRGDRLKVRCVANMYDIYHQSAEKSLYLEKPTSRPSPQPPPDILIIDNSSPMVLVNEWEIPAPSEKSAPKQEQSFTFWSFGLSAAPTLSNSWSLLSGLLLGHWFLLLQGFQLILR